MPSRALRKNESPAELCLGTAIGDLNTLIGIAQCFSVKVTTVRPRPRHSDAGTTSAGTGGKSRRNA
jgi:hypothetical protein